MSGHDAQPYCPACLGDGLFLTFSGHILCPCPAGEELGQMRARALMDREIEAVADRWVLETHYHSSPAAIREHPCFLDLRGREDLGVRLALRRLREGPAYIHWFLLLGEITGASPEHAGRVEEMRRDWLSWGKTNGFLEGET